MEFKKKKLTNGLSIVGEVNKSAKSAAVGFFVKTGSRDETAQISGVSHFLEHMLFKGTEKLNSQQVNEAFDKTGAQFNAFTSEETTVYYAAVMPEYLDEVTTLWTELMRPALRDEDFNIEKNVIKEEIAMYKDIPTYTVYEKCRELYFGEHPCGNSVLGSVESIDKLSAAQMREYFSRRYVPNNMTVACAGNFNWEQISSIVEKTCVKWARQETTRKLEDWPGTKKTERIEKPKLAREHICLMSRSVPIQDKRRFATALLGTVIGDSTGSRYFWELVDTAFADTASMQYVPMDGTGAFYTYISCGSDNVPRVMEIVGNIFSKLSKEGVTEKELKTAKNKILSSLVIKNELPMGRLIDLGFNWTYLQQYHTVEDEMNAINAVNLADISSLIEILKPGEFTQVFLGPGKAN
jgi:predicted Zn-dependent peptidase